MEGIAINFPELSGDTLRGTKLTSTQAQQYTPIMQKYRATWKEIQNQIPEGALRNNCGILLEQSFNAFVLALTGKAETLAHSAGT